MATFVRLRVASCSNARRRVDVSVVVVVVVLRTCEPCDPDLLSLEVLRKRSVAALAGRDCCWRRAAEARLSATEAPREGGLEAIAGLVHSIWKCCFCYIFKLQLPAWRVCELSSPSCFIHSLSHQCGDLRVQPKQKARLAGPIEPSADLPQSRIGLGA